jgi:CubicO group peptidase (beta-lactamase class C family)
MLNSKAVKKLLLLLYFLPVILSAQKNNTGNKTSITNPHFKNIQDSILRKINKGVIPSFSVSVSQKGKIIWQQSFGWADKEKNIKATPSTSYAIASLSKSITSTALMILIEKGLVSFNDRVDKYLGNAKLTYYKGKASQLTIGHLTNMMGGIPHQFEYFYADEKKQPPSIEEQLKRYGIVVFPPGQSFNYSNFSPGIVEQIIKNVAHKNLAQFMKEMMFVPLEMNHAAVNRNDVLGTTIAKGYDGSGHLLPQSEFYPKAGAGYYASVTDLIRFGMFHLKDRIKGIIPVLRDENIELLHSSGELPGYNKFYSNGWGVLKIGNGKNSLISNGAIAGTASSLLLLPDADIAIACLTNATVGNDFTDQVAFSIANILLPGYMDELGKFVEINGPAFADTPFHPADSLIGTWEGHIKTYRDSISIRMVFDTTGKIFVQIQGQFETLLNNATTNNGLISGQCFGNISLPETEGIPHYL